MDAHRSGPLFLVLQTAAALDDRVASLWDRAKATRLKDCERLLHLAGVPSDEVPWRAQLLFVLSGPGVQADLVGDRGWMPDEYQRWLGGEVLRLLDAGSGRLGHRDAIGR